jgi:D-arabinose 1-dehydrogenase-like Zn-dependent alcohol dehydrogenase
VLGVVFKGDRRVALDRFPDPAPGPHQVVVEIKASGMCGSDLHAYRKATGNSDKVIGGHEPSGVVVALGPSVAGGVARVGARVMVHHYHGCTTCEQCRTGWAQLCANGETEIYGINRNGAHAPYMLVAADTLVPLDDRLSFIAGAAISCGTGTAWGALKRMNLSGRDTIAIFGQGPVGLSATQLAATQGARVIALDVEPARLAKSKAFGAVATINPSGGHVKEQILELTRGQGADKSLETSGSSAAARDALHALKTWGTATFVGLGAEVAFDVRAFLGKQITIMTSWSMSIQDQKACADFIIERGTDIDSLFTDNYRIERAETAYRDFDRQSGGKGVFLFG